MKDTLKLLCYLTNLIEEIQNVLFCCLAGDEVVYKCRILMKSVIGGFLTDVSDDVDTNLAGQLIPGGSQAGTKSGQEYQSGDDPLHGVCSKTGSVNYWAFCGQCFGKDKNIF